MLLKTGKELDVQRMPNANYCGKLVNTLSRLIINLNLWSNYSYQQEVINVRFKKVNFLSTT